MIISLTCPKCGGKLEVTPDIDRFACGHCGTEHIVQRQGGTVSLAPVVQQLERIGAGTDRAAAELALPRLLNEEAQLQANLDRLLAAESSEKSAKANKLPYAILMFLLSGSLACWVLERTVAAFGNAANSVSFFAAIVVVLLAAGSALIGISLWSSYRRDRSRTSTCAEGIAHAQALLEKKRQQLADCRRILDM